MNLLSSMKYLVALNEHRHFARAAGACHITQPALSNALRALEEEYNVVIVRRGRAFAGLTPEGEQVLAAGQRMLREQQVLQQSLKSTAHSPVGGLVIGAVPTAVPIAARFAAMLQAQHPAILPVVLSLSSSELEARLDSLSIDLGLGYIERMGQGVSSRRLCPSTSNTIFYFAVPPNRTCKSCSWARLSVGKTLRSMLCVC